MAFALTCLPAAVAGADAPKLVVVVYPDASDGAPGIVLVNRAIRSTFANESPAQIEVHNEYVATARLPDPDFAQAQVSLLRRKYAGRKVDLVIAGLSSGLDFAVKHRDELFPGAPIVYVAVDEREVKARRLPPDVIGTPIRMDLAATLDLAVRFHPDTRRVFVVAGNAPFDAYWVAEARRTFRSREDRLEFVYLTGLPMAELLDRVAGLPAQSIIYYLHIYQDGAGTPVIPAEALERLAARANAPVYGHVDTYVGRGIVGGRVFTFEAEGRSAARLGLRIIAGEKAESIPLPEVSNNTDLFDWRQLRRWDIDEQTLPPGSVVRYKDLTFWAAYRWQVVGAVSACVIEGLLIAGLLVQLVKRRRAEERFRQVIETAPTGMLVVSHDGTIVMVNGRVEEIYGYRRDELLGRPVDLLVPEHLRDQYAADRAGFFAVPHARPMGLGRNLSGRRKGGTEFPIEVGLNPLRTPRGQVLVVSIIDITERQRATVELQTSRQELKLLTRRLLEAQEGERRRVARELHDDVNQGLALLAVEIDLLARRPPDSAEQTADRLRALSARVKALSSSVHDLSHQLHPSKLEQLGLVAAVRGLCRELDQYHGLSVVFTHDDAPELVPEDVALCLYRIVQEGLRNVLRHSGTRAAVVDLTGTPVGIRLRIGDDGGGFDPASAHRRGGLGLISMRERLHLVGGEITIDSRPSGGTRIDVQIRTPAESPVGRSFQVEMAGS